jgi:hypothetical protein
MKKILLAAGLLMSFGVSAEMMTNLENGQIYITDDRGAYTNDGTRLNRAGNSDIYFGTDGGTYQQQGNQIRQIGGFPPPPQQNNEVYRNNGNSGNGSGNQTNYSDPTSRLNGNRFVPWH